MTTPTLPIRISVLAVAQTLVWAALHYSFAALLPHWEHALGWSLIELASAFTLSLLASAAFAPLVGRLIDRRHGPKILTFSALGGGLLMLVLATVTAPWQFYAIWLGLGICTAGALYEPCFAHLTQALAGNARRAITLITIVAGFAGSVAFVFAHLVVERYGWRGAVIGFGLITIGITVPLTWWGANLPISIPSTTPDHRNAQLQQAQAAARNAIRTPRFWLLASAFALLALEHGMLITHILPIMAAYNVEAGLAVLLASLVGPMQVLGRVVMITWLQRIAIATVCIVSSLLLVVAAGSLLAAAIWPLLIFVFVVFQGAGFGITSITRPVLTAAYLGSVGFGSISGIQASLFVGALALGPMLAAVLQQYSGYAMVIMVCIVMNAIAMVCFVFSTRLPTAAVK